MVATKPDNEPVIIDGLRVFRVVYYWFVERYTDGPDDGQWLMILDSKAAAVQWARWFLAGEIES